MRRQQIRHPKTLLQHFIWLLYDLLAVVDCGRVGIAVDVRLGHCPYLIIHIVVRLLGLLNLHIREINLYQGLVRLFLDLLHVVLHYHVTDIPDLTAIQEDLLSLHHLLQLNLWLLRSIHFFKLVFQVLLRNVEQLTYLREDCLEVRREPMQAGLVLAELGNIRLLLLHEEVHQLYDERVDRLIRIDASLFGGILL